MTTLEIAKEEKMLALGGALAGLAEPGDVVTLTGDLGAGKSVLARGFVRAMAGDPGLDVPSPTFTLVYTYETGLATVWHFDLYRVEDAGDLRELGLEEALDEGIALIEWPQVAAAWLPDERLDIVIRQGEGDVRQVTLRPFGSWIKRIEHVA